jgi:uncharacterized membrane protein
LRKLRQHRGDETWSQADRHACGNENEVFVPSPFVFWPSLACVLFLIIGLFAVRREFAAALGLDKLVVLGRVFFAAPLAVFGAEHLAGPRILMQGVPVWMPGRLFWAYLVGFALVAAAISIILMKYVRLSAALLGVMILLFVLMIHLPRAARNPRDLFAWTIVFRELAFAGGVWALAGTQTEAWRIRGSHWLIVLGRVLIAVTAIFFGVEHFLRPGGVPGVPLNKLIPAWIPLRIVWGYLTGAVLLAAGAGLLVKKQARSAATALGLMITLLVFCIYLPMLVASVRASQVIEGLNYFADTMFFGGAILLLAAALPKDVPAQAQPSLSRKAGAN